MKIHFRPKLLDTLPGYNRTGFVQDLSAGITVGVLGLTPAPVTGKVPEPASLALIGGALAALAAARRKR